MSFLNKVYAAIGDWKKAGYELVFITGRSKVFAYGYSLGVNNLRSSYGVFALDSKGKLAGWLLGVQSPDAQKLWDQKDRPFGKDD